MTTAERRLNRREALLGAGLVGAGALAILTPVAAAAESGESGFEGAWLVTVTPDTATTPAPHRVLFLTTKGGGVAAVADNPPSSGSTGFGAWQRTADGQFLATFELFTFTPLGQSTGILRLRTLATLDEETDGLTGRANIDFQPNEGPFIPAGTTHFTGTRIKPVAL